MSTLFISDLHLCQSRPEITSMFVRFLEREARAARFLYILGDLFEYWAGDDDLADPFSADIVAAIRRLVEAGVQVGLLRGNRDFLLGEAFVSASGARLLDDPALVDVSGTPTLLLHGDTLCTLDLEYQAFRRTARSPEWVGAMLAKPLSTRKAEIELLRARSEREKGRKSVEIMDVSIAEVESVLRAHGYPRMIHGHTHRPARHVHRIDGHSCERWVLADWYRTGSYLACIDAGCATMQVAP